MKILKICFGVLWLLLKMIFCKHDYIHHRGGAYYDDDWKECSKCGYNKKETL